MNHFRVTPEKAIELMSRGIEAELIAQVRKEINKVIEPLLTVVAGDIARQIKLRMDTLEDPRGLTTQVIVNFDGVQNVKLV